MDAPWTMAAVEDATGTAQARALFLEYAAELGEDLCFQGFEAELAGLPGKYAAPDGGLWLAVRQGRAGGCVALRRVDDATCEMKRLYVRPMYRGGGLGRQLALHALHAAGLMGYRRMVLDTLARLRPALALYASLGLAPTEPYYANPLPGVVFLAKRLV